MAAPLNNTLELKQPENGKAPKTRIEDASCAASIIATLVEANQSRAAVDAKVKGTLDGNPPFDAAKLRAANQSNRCNVNFREAEGIHDAAHTPYYDLFAESPCYCEVNLDIQGPEHSLKSRIVTEEFDYMLRSYDGWDYTVQMSTSNMVDFGRGFVMWPDDENWQPDWVKHSKVYVPDQAPASLDKLELMVIREAWPLHKLWSKIKDKETSGKVGWNSGAVARAMRNSVPNSQQEGSPTDDYEYWQSKLRNNDLYESISLNAVKAAHVLVKEYDGKISHYIVEETGPGANKTTDQTVPKQDYLYKKIGRFESFRQIVGLMFYDLGDGTWHSIKGLLIKMHPFIEIKNRLTCAGIDNVFLNMSVLVETQNAKDVANVSLLHIGPMTVLPPGFKPVQWGLAGRLEEALAYDRHLDNKLQGNIGTYRRTVPRERGNPETATKEQIDAAKEAMLSKGAVNRFYSQMDFIYEEMYRRAVQPKLRNTSANKMAKDFQEKCRKRGVPAEELRKVRQVRAYRNIGNGSIFMRQQAIAQTAQLVPMLNEQGRQNWLDDAIAASASYEMTERWNPKGDFDPKIQQDERMAALQVAAAKEGVPPVPTDLDNHVVFADKFIMAAAQSIESIQKVDEDDQMRATVEVLAFLEIIMPSALRHLQQIKGDSTRKPAYDALMEAFKRTAQQTNQLRQWLQQMQKQKAQEAKRQRQVMNEEELKTMKTRADISRKERKLAMDLSAKGAKTRQQLAIADVKTAREIEREEELDAARVNGE